MVLSRNDREGRLRKNAQKNGFRIRCRLRPSPASSKRKDKKWNDRKMEEMPMGRSRTTPAHVVHFFAIHFFVIKSFFSGWALIADPTICSNGQNPRKKMTLAAVNGLASRGAR
jgi:hypothetical protein